MKEPITPWAEDDLAQLRHQAKEHARIKEAAMAKAADVNALGDAASCPLCTFVHCHCLADLDAVLKELELCQRLTVSELSKLASTQARPIRKLLTAKWDTPAGQTVIRHTTLDLRRDLEFPCATWCLRYDAHWIEWKQDLQGILNMQRKQVSSSALRRQCMAMAREGMRQIFQAYYGLLPKPEEITQTCANRLLTDVLKYQSSAGLAVVEGCHVIVGRYRDLIRWRLLYEHVECRVERSLTMVQTRGVAWAWSEARHHLRKQVQELQSA